MAEVVNELAVAQLLSSSMHQKQLEIMKCSKCCLVFDDSDTKSSSSNSFDAFSERQSKKSGESLNTTSST
jgi:hypothetical protein